MKRHVPCSFLIKIRCTVLICWIWWNSGRFTASYSYAWLNDFSFSVYTRLSQHLRIVGQLLPVSITPSSMSMTPWIQYALNVTTYNLKESAAHSAHAQIFADRYALRATAPLLRFPTSRSHVSRSYGELVGKGKAVMKLHVPLAFLITIRYHFVWICWIWWSCGKSIRYAAMLGSIFCFSLFV